MAEDSPASDLAASIAEALGERRAWPRREIGLVVEALGPETTWQLVDQAQTIHAGAGMLVGDGSRKRTLGGVFFELAKRALSAENYERIFGESARRRRAAYLKREARRAQQDTTPPRPEPTRWSAELTHVPTGKSSDAAAPRIVEVARGLLDGAYGTEAEAVAAGKRAVRAALEKLYRSRLKSIQPPQITVHGVRVK